MARSSGGKLNPRKIVAKDTCSQLCIDLTFRLQRFIHLLDIAEIVLPLERYCPGLYVTKCLVLDITVQRGRFQYGNKVIHEFSRGYLH